MLYVSFRKTSNVYFWPVKKLIVFLLVLISIASCKIEQCEEVVPSLEFSEFQQRGGDSATMILKFRDCDGDFGFLEDDVDSSMVKDSTDRYNLFMDYYYRENAEWKKYTPPAGFPGFYYRVPRLENRSVSSTLEGEIHIDMNGYHLAFFGDTLRYEIYALDRAKNITNIVETPTIIAD